MTAPVKKLHVSILLLVLMASFSAFAGLDRDLNQTDDQGQRQGYWIIKGYMSDLGDYGPNATVEEGQYSNDLKEGVWKKYWPDGVVRSEITYSEGRPYGPYTIYYPNGQVEEQSTWHRNKNVGEFQRFYENGNPQQAFFFSDNGKRNGMQRYYYENGQLALEVTVLNGKEEGTMRRFYENGMLKEVKVLDDGAVKPGTTRKFSANAPRQGSKTESSSEPKKVTSPPAEDEQVNRAHKFEPNGYNVLYNAIQQVTQVGDFRNGRLWNGKWYRYSQDGILIRIEIFKNGKYLGTGVIEDKNL
jgi:antitoxin component YwqK of YwqJK toxin-antitoxin module